MEEKKEGLSRRSFLSNSAVGAIGLAAVGFSAGSLINPKEAEAAQLGIGVTDFPHFALDVEKVRQYGYYCYWQFGGCGAGASRALIQGMLDAAPTVEAAKGWAQVPLQLYAWGGGGGMGTWGTLCGALAGSVGVLNLMDLHGKLGTAVMEWYTNQNFPLANFDNPATPYDTTLAYGGKAALAWPPIPDGQVKGHSVSDSPLCHISVSKWVASAGVKLGDKTAGGQGLKEDRCAKVTADTAAYTAELLNAYLASNTNVPAAWKPEANMAGCYDCHDNKTSALFTKRDSQTMMDCVPCHTTPTSGRK